MKENKKVLVSKNKSLNEDVKKALDELEVNFFSYWDVTGIGNEKQGHVYRGISYSTSEIQRRFLSIIVNDEFVERTVDGIIKSGATERVGDGKIFILPV